MYDRGDAERTKGKVYKTVVRPTFLYGLETAPLIKGQEVELEVAKMKMLRFKKTGLQMQIRGTELYILEIK